ncbi:MAG: tetratricopeptide repeat protein [Magnetococcales bacterium]|nr:tetratricopeptide repeat protein [Magnetococcales bacterium]
MSLIGQLLNDLHQREVHSLDGVDLCDLGVTFPDDGVRVQGETSGRKVFCRKEFVWAFGMALVLAAGIFFLSRIDQGTMTGETVPKQGEQEEMDPSVSSLSEPEELAPSLKSATRPIATTTTSVPGVMGSMAIDEESVAPSGVIRVPESEATQPPAPPVATSPSVPASVTERPFKLGLSKTPPRKNESPSPKQGPSTSVVANPLAARTPEVVPVRRGIPTPTSLDNLATMTLENPHAPVSQGPATSTAGVRVAQPNRGILENGEMMLPLQKAQSLGWARTLVEDGQLDEAERVVREHLSQDGDSIAALGIMASLEQKRGNLENSNRYFNRLLRLEPDQYRWWFGLAVNLEKAKRDKEAISYYRHLIKMNDVAEHVVRFAEERIRVLESGQKH